MQDIIWDVVAGRLGQVFLVYIACRVYATSLTYVMEAQAVGFDTYGGLSVSTGNLAAVGVLIRALCSDRFPAKKRAYRIFITLLLSTLYIASMPTLFSAMTGYAPVRQLASPHARCTD